MLSSDSLQSFSHQFSETKLSQPKKFSLLSFPFFAILNIHLVGYEKYADFGEDWKSIIYQYAQKKYSRIIIFQHSSQRISSIFQPSKLKAVSVMIRMEMNLWSHLTFTIFFNSETGDFWVGIKFHDIFSFRFFAAASPVPSQCCACRDIQMMLSAPRHHRWGRMKKLLWKSFLYFRAWVAICCKVISMAVKANAS